MEVESNLHRRDVGTTQKQRFELDSRAMSLLTGPGLMVLPISVDKENLVLLRNHLEASEGLGYIVAKRGGNVMLVSHESRREEFNIFVRDLKSELGIRLGLLPAHEEVRDVAE